jgi:putative spermidine/putrescine transport system ATP-binding protein
VTVIVRPESIVPLREDEQMPNTFQGVVEDAIYLGKVTRYQIRVGATTVVAADWQNRTGVPLFRRKERVRVGWLIEDAVSL